MSAMRSGHTQSAKLFDLTSDDVQRTETRFVLIEVPEASTGTTFGPQPGREVSDVWGGELA
jgi:hypothetical protein